MNVRRLPPRSINAMKGVREYIKEWDKPQTDLGQPLPLILRSQFGNLNCSGDASCPSGQLLAPHEHGFSDALEGGVRDLVLAFVNRHGWITYTSCEGHEYPGSTLRPVERHVGLLPRDRYEWRAIRTYLVDAITRLSAQSVSSAAEFALMEHSLVDGGEAFPVLDIYIAARHEASWAAYFADLANSYEKLVGHVAHW